MSTEPVTRCHECGTPARYVFHGYGWCSSHRGLAERYAPIVRDYGADGYTLTLPRAADVGRSRIHTVDVGPCAITPTHTTRDGLPMSVQYALEHGYAVAVDNTPTKDES